MTPATRPLARPLRERINKVAHQAGIAHEARIRAELMARLQAARDAGQSLAELTTHIQALEVQS